MEKKEGVWTYWNEFDELEMEENYLDGELDGVKAIMFLGGSGVYLEESYKNGKRNGLRIEYSRSNKKIAEAEWANDVLSGYSKFWYENGQLRINEYFLNGKLNGLRKIFYDNGQIKFVEE